MMENSVNNSTIRDFYIWQYYYIQTILNIPKGRKNSLDYTLVILSYFVFYFCHKRASSSWQLLISPLQLPFKLAILLLARSGCWLARGNNSETLTLPLDSYYWNNRVVYYFQNNIDLSVLIFFFFYKTQSKLLYNFAFSTNFQDLFMNLRNILLLIFWFFKHWRWKKLHKYIYITNYMPSFLEIFSIQKSNLRIILKMTNCYDK